MGFRLKIVILVAFVALVPLVLLASTALSLHQRALEEKIDEQQHRAAEYAARLAQRDLDGVFDALRLGAGAIQWQALTEAERKGALWLVYRQVDPLAAVALLDAQGSISEGPVYVADANDDDLKRHPRATTAMLETLRSALPPLRAEVTHSEVIAADGPLMLSRVPLQGGLSLVAAVSLGMLCADVADAGNVTTYLLDARCARFCDKGSEAAVTQAEPALCSALAVAQRTLGLRLHEARAEPALATLAHLPIGWAVVTEQPESEVFATVRKLLRRTVMWALLAVLAALGSGLLLAQSVVSPVQELADAATQLEQGQFDRRVTVRGDDEIGVLSQAFNRMSDEIARRDREIREWNDELQARVEARQRELQEVQEQLAQSQKISAVLALGAGIAHEINNPLTGVLGVSQVVRRRLSPEQGNLGEMLQTLEREALRIKSIVQALSSMSQHQAAHAMTPLLVTDVLDKAVTQADLGAIVVSRDYAAELPPIAGNKAQLEEVFVQLLQNARTAVSDAAWAQVKLSARLVDGKLVRVEISDNGRGIAPERLSRIFEPFYTTKSDWTGRGLGLTLAFRVVEEHLGKIKVESTVGTGTNVIVTLPASQGAHIV